MRACLVVLAACSSPAATVPPHVVPADAPPPVDAPVAVVEPDAPPPAPVPEPGLDFIAEARTLYRVVGCGGDGPLGAELAKFQAVVDRHCKALGPAMDRYRAQYFGTARAWFVDHEPKDLPKTVVYLFSGGDLASALVAFPDATEITTVSLEQAGDPRKLPALTPAQLDADLAAFRSEIGMLLANGSNTSANLSKNQRNILPGQIGSFLLSLATGGYEPVAMRYFAIDDTGGIHYLEKADIDADTKAGKSLSGSWRDPTFASVFRNVEIRYRAIGATDVRVHRHIAWNLEDGALKRASAVLAHLDGKGKVTTLVKGASYLLWLENFAMIRHHILDHLGWMLSDSTGIPPTYAIPAGMVQEAFGRFDTPVLAYAAGTREHVDTKKLFATAREKMPFRFGYLDSTGNNHVMITRPKPPSP